MRRFAALALCGFHLLSAGCQTPPRIANNTGASGGPSAAGGSAGGVNHVDVVAESVCVPPEAFSLDNVSLAPQEQNSWCWAASGQMIMTFLKRPVDQCTQVSRAAHTTCACQKTCNAEDPVDDCNNGGWPDFNGFSFDSRETVSLDDDPHLAVDDPKRALPVEELKRQLYCLHSPVAFTWKTGSSTGHMMVLYGYNGAKLLARDPAPPCEGRGDMVLNYDGYLRDNSPRFAHWRDQFELKARPL